MSLPSAWIDFFGVCLHDTYMASIAENQALDVLFLFLGSCDRKAWLRYLRYLKGVQEHQVPYRVMQGIIMALSNYGGNMPQIDNQSELLVNFY